jgi:hypothetical protein
MMWGVVAQFCSALATFVVGLAAMNMGRTQTKASLFDHRFKVYSELSQAIAEISADAAVRDEALDAIHRGLHASRFLYSEEVYRQVDLIWHAANGARWLAPLEHRKRSKAEQEQEAHQREEINNVWAQLEPLMSRSLATWNR